MTGDRHANAKAYQLGLLIFRVRAVFGGGAHARRVSRTRWGVFRDAWLHRKALGMGDTEEEALLAALEAAS